MEIKINHFYSVLMISFLSLTKGVLELSNFPLFLIVLVLIIIFSTFLNHNFNFEISRIMFPRFFLGIFVILHGGLWDLIIGLCYIVTALYLTLFFKYSVPPKKITKNLFITFLITYYLGCLILYLVKPDIVLNLDRGIDLRFSGLAGDPNFLAITTITVLFYFFKKKSIPILISLFMLYLTESRTATIVFLIFIFFYLKKVVFTKKYFTIFAYLLFFILLFIVFNVQDEIITKLRFDKIESQNRMLNLWIPVIESTDIDNPYLFLFGQGSHFSKDILGVYLHSSILETFIEYGFIGLSLLVWEIKYLYKLSKNSNSLYLLFSFVLINSLFSIHWGIISVLLISLIFQNFKDVNFKKHLTTR